MHGIKVYLDGMSSYSTVSSSCTCGSTACVDTTTLNSGYASVVHLIHDITIVTQNY